MVSLKSGNSPSGECCVKRLINGDEKVEKISAIFVNESNPLMVDTKSCIEKNIKAYARL